MHVHAGYALLLLVQSAEGLSAQVHNFGILKTCWNYRVVDPWKFVCGDFGVQGFFSFLWGVGEGGRVKGYRV